MRIAFCTQNIAPFRMKWVDELAKTFNIKVFHLNEYESGLNKKYISYSPKNVCIEDISFSIFKNTNIYNFKKFISYNPEFFILDGYGFFGQQLLIIYLWLKKIPFIMSIDGGFVNQSESKVKYFIKRFFVSKANAYLSTSNETDYFIDYYGGKKKKNIDIYFPISLNHI